MSQQNIDNGQLYELPPVHVAGPTGWLTIPKPVRFAVWIWAIAVMVSLAGAVIAGAVMALGIILGLAAL